MYEISSVFPFSRLTFSFLLGLGQGLHCMEDFGAHTNYCELALRELGYRDVFPHTGVAAEINVRGHHIFPLVTGTFGAVDFLHSVLGEATDHFTQTEVSYRGKSKNLLSMDFFRIPPTLLLDQVMTDAHFPIG